MEDVHYGHENEMDEDAEDEDEDAEMYDDEETGSEDTSATDEEDEEAAAELTAKFSRRQLGTNADRYKEPEPELDSDGTFSWYISCKSSYTDTSTNWSVGEPIVEPEVDLSTFLEKQRISKADTVLGAKKDVDEDEVEVKGVL